MGSKLKVIDLGLRDSMTGQQILAEASKWDWDSFVLVGWVNNAKPTTPVEGKEGEEAEDDPPRLVHQYHPNTTSSEVIVLAELIKAEAVEDILNEP